MKAELLAGGFLALCLVAATIWLLVKKRAQANCFSKKDLLTDNEKEFFSRLIQAVPECYVYPQVALSAILKVTANNPKERIRLRNRFSQKYADFIVTDQTLKVMAIIELDDKTHNQAKDKKRDAMLNSAGYATLRYQSKDKPQPGQIRSDILGTMTGRL